MVCLAWSKEDPLLLSLPPAPSTYKIGPSAAETVLNDKSKNKPINRVVKYMHLVMVILTFFLHP